MKYKTLFRVLLKVLGVWLFANGVTSLLGQLGYLALVFGSQGRPGGQRWYMLFNLLATIPQLGMGLYLFFGGKWVADKAIPGNRPYCHECGYDLTNASGNLCSECGTPFKPAAEASSVP